MDAKLGLARWLGASNVRTVNNATLASYVSGCRTPVADPGSGILLTPAYFRIKGSTKSGQGQHKEATHGRRVARRWPGLARPDGPLTGVPCNPGYKCPPPSHYVIGQPVALRNLGLGPGTPVGVDAATRARPGCWEGMRRHARKSARIEVSALKTPTVAPNRPAGTNEHTHVQSQDARWCVHDASISDCDWSRGRPGYAHPR